MSRRMGINWQDFCRRSGVDPTVTDMQNAVTAGAELRLQQGFFAATTNTSNLWVELGLGYRAASYGSFGIAMMTAENLGEIFAGCSQYQALTYSLIKYNLIAAADGSSRLVGEDAGIPGAFRNFSLYRDLGLIRTLIQDLTGNSGEVVEGISLAAPPPENWDELQASFPCPVEFNAQITQWRFRRGATSVPAIMSDRNLCDAYTQECVRQITACQPPVSLVQRLEALLDSDEDWFPSLSEAARRFAMSERTFHRRLKDEGRTLSEVINDAKIRKAKKLLASRSASLPDIAMKLRFSDASGLSRAFKRQTGMSIKDFREALPPLGGALSMLYRH
ncbi:AraC family transcriptional regulator [Sphingobium sp. JS3065]|uniref:AraC family transcriptional regulator n=1 Tax=Sphingobium sp. JS3065 TaxID=2970925 RepID=UPI0022642976|nr:AraC family transcriptional regulator [Sphingobium sp. JS3065]UZW56433.1 AraC family transcriptional regulator [Sphingobium sp. JS3065]